MRIRIESSVLNVGNERNFLAKKCTSLLNLPNCNGKLYPMGYDAPFDLKGNYFLKTHSKKPYGNNRTSNKPICT